MNYWEEGEYNQKGLWKVEMSKQVAMKHYGLSLWIKISKVHINASDVNYIQRFSKIEVHNLLDLTLSYNLSEP